MRDLNFEIRRMDNLHRAWGVVKANVLASGKDEFRAQVEQISRNPIGYLRSIQGRLQRNTFKFGLQRGVPIRKKTGGHRPIVIAPIENRIVQRAILNVLQSDYPNVSSRLGEIPTIIRTRTSVGGVPERGVPDAIKVVQEAMDNHQTTYLRSDIKAFFTKIPKIDVVDLVRDQTKDADFANFLAQALTTELENEEEIKGLVHLFPTTDSGVPQGSSLSALCGNIVLRRFDKELNGRGITTIRYIDDFVILGPSERTVRKTFLSAERILKTTGMEAYDPESDPGKAEKGHLKNGMDFLGYRVLIDSVMPSRTSRQRFLNDLRTTIRDGKRRISDQISFDGPRRAEKTYVQILDHLDNKIRGWGDAFSCSTTTLPFTQLDKTIDDLLAGFDDWYAARTRRLDGKTKRRARGIALLSDTPFHEPSEDTSKEFRNDQSVSQAS